MGIPPAALSPHVNADVDVLPPLLVHLWWLAILTAPWSVEVSVGFGARLSVPQEPLLAMILLLALRSFRRSDWPRIRFLFGHAITVAIGGSLVWTAVAAAFSTHPDVSFKVLLVRGVQAAVFFGGAVVVLSTADATRKLAKAGALGLLPIAVWAIVRSQIMEGWQARHASAAPFFPNRLELTVVAAFWLLALLGSQRRESWLWSCLIALPLAGAVFLLYGRAAIIGLAAGLVGWLVARQRKRPELVAITSLLVVTVSGALAADLWLWRETVGRPYRPTTVLEPVHRLVSASGLYNDESLLERLNRWRCAVLMADERPLVGFGPGTFEREYASYQRPGDRTRWSTDGGDLGDAHSEHLGRLAEEGFPGFTLQLVVFIVMAGTGLRTAREAQDPAVVAAAAAWTGAVTGLAVASLFVGISDLSGIGFAPWLAAAALLRLDLISRQEPALL